jgi:hypothetical protein
MGSPRVDVVFRLWQCDKENHGWREGPPRPFPAKFRSAGRAFTLRQSQFRTKEEYCFPLATASPSPRRLAGIKGLPARVVSGTFPSPAHAEGHWLAASGAIKIYCATDSSKYCMARQAYCIFWQN